MKEVLHLYLCVKHEYSLIIIFLFIYEKKIVARCEMFLRQWTHKIQIYPTPQHVFVMPLEMKVIKNNTNRNATILQKSCSSFSLQGKTE